MLYAKHTRIVHCIHFETVSMVSQRVEAYTLDHTLRGICIENRTQQNATPRHVLIGCFHHSLRMSGHVHGACLIPAALKLHVHIFHVEVEGQP